MGVAAHQLVVQGLRHIRQIKATLFLSHLTKKHDLKKQITQFGFQIAPIARLNSIMRGRLNFVRFFYRKFG